jgi:hypothetical protein
MCVVRARAHNPGHAHDAQPQVLVVLRSARRRSARAPAAGVDQRRSQLPQPAAAAAASAPAAAASDASGTAAASAAAGTC